MAEGDNTPSTEYGGFRTNTNMDEATGTRNYAAAKQRYLDNQRLYGNIPGSTTYSHWNGSVIKTDQIIANLKQMSANEPAEYAKYEKVAELNNLTVEGLVSYASVDNQKRDRDILSFGKWRAKQPAVVDAYKSNQAGSGGGPFSSTQTSINLSTESQAGNILDANFDEQLGRTSTDAEAQDFQKALNEQQRQNPSVSTQKGYSSGSNTTSTSTSSGQFDPTRFAREYASQQDGADERYAGQTFMDILDLAISKPNAISEMLGSVNG
jgi:hypothetical protein